MNLFHSSTTLRHSRFAQNPLKTGGLFINFKYAETWKSMTETAVGKGISTMWDVLYPVRLLASPVLIPLQITKWAAQKTWKWGVEPVLRVASAVSGTAIEAAGGAKDAIVNPAKSVGGAALHSLKMKAWDLPGHVWDSAWRLPGHLVRLPGSFLKEMWGMVKEVPENAKKIISNVRKNVGGIIEHGAHLEPLQAVKSGIGLFRDLIKDTLVDPVKSTAGHFTRPFLPHFSASPLRTEYAINGAAFSGGILEMPLGAASIVANSELQYIPAIRDAYKGFWNGCKRVWKSPGKSLDTSGFKKWKEEVFPPKKPKTPPVEGAGHEAGKGAEKPAADRGHDKPTKDDHDKKGADKGGHDKGKKDDHAHAAGH